VKRGYKNTSHVAERLLDWEEAGYQLDSEAAVAHSGARRPMGAPNAGTTENRFAASPQFFSKV
jgi:hypothetical protein